MWLPGPQGAFWQFGALAQAATPFGLTARGGHLQGDQLSNKDPPTTPQRPLAQCQRPRSPKWPPWGPPGNHIGPSAGAATPL